MRPSMKSTFLVVFVVCLGIISAVIFHNIYRPRIEEQKIPKLSFTRDINARKMFNIHVKAVVIRDGEVIDIRIDRADPVTKNLYALIYNYLLGGVAGENAASYKDTDGNSRENMDTEYGGSNPSISVAIGDGTGAPSKDDYKLASVYKVNSTPETTYSENATTITYNYTATFYIDTNINITEAGLILEDVDYYPYSSSRLCDVLIARELFTPPISLTTGDYLILSYILYINKSGNFVRSFYALLNNYYFWGTGLEKQNYTDTSGINHTDMDTEDETYPYGKNPEVYVSIGNSSTTFNLSVYRLTNPVLTASGGVAYQDNPTNFTVIISALFTFNRDCNITELGLIIKLDSDSGSAVSETDVLILYKPFDTPIQVSAGQKLVFTVKIVFKYS